MRFPSDILNLKHWTLTGPKNAAVIISAAQLDGGWSDPDFFFVRTDAVVFKTPKTGSVTTNATKPRSELREQIAPPSNETNWPLSGQHTLRAVCAVVSAPKDDRIFIAQIHGKRWNHPVVKLAYRLKDNAVTLDVKAGPNGSDLKTVLAKVKPGKLIGYELAIKNGMLSARANGRTMVYSLTELGFPLNDADWYFKAGCYGPSGEVEFTTLETKHDN